TPESAASQRWVRFAKSDHSFEEAEHVAVLFEQIPVEPRRFVILVPGIVLAISQIVLVVVRDEIIETKAVVRSDVVDALSRMVGVVEIIRKQIAAAIEPGHEIANFSGIAFDEFANIISKPAIPLAPCLAGEATT